LILRAAEKEPLDAFKTAQTFSGTQADNFAPALSEEPLEEEGRQKRSWNPRCVLNAACGAKW
jgi:hypothetical protein